MRDQYAGDLSDVIKFGLLRALAGPDRKLGVAWYYAPGDDGRPDGRHLEWQTDPAWIEFDPQLHRGLSSLPERSIAALEAADIWPLGSTFHRDPMPRRVDRQAWSARKRHDLDGADIVFLDPDNGLGGETEKHATFAELRALRKPGRSLVFITFPGRTMPHDRLVTHLHDRVVKEAGATGVITLRTNVSIPAAPGSTSLVQRQRWFTVADPDEVMFERLGRFAAALSAVPRVTARLEHYCHPSLESCC